MAKETSENRGASLYLVNMLSDLSPTVTFGMSKRLLTGQPIAEMHLKGDTSMSGISPILEFRLG